MSDVNPTSVTILQESPIVLTLEGQPNDLSVSTSPAIELSVVMGLQGPPGQDGTGVSHMGEIPSGVIDGSNSTFTTAFDFIPESVEVFVNGLRQLLPLHYVTTGTRTIILSDSLTVGDLITVNYLEG